MFTWRIWNTNKLQDVTKSQDTEANVFKFCRSSNVCWNFTTLRYFKTPKSGPYTVSLLTSIFLSENLTEKNDLCGATEFWKCRAAWGVKEDYISHGVVMFVEMWEPHSHPAHEPSFQSLIIFAIRYLSIKCSV